MTARQKLSSERGPKDCSATLRWLQLLAAAVFALVCAGVFAPSEGASSLEAASEAVTAARTAHGSHVLHDGSEREELDLDAVEADLDDDDDIDGHHRQPSFADYADITFEHARHVEAHPRDTALTRDPSRFAIGHGFARGPPA